MGVSIVTTMSITPFRIRVPAPVLADLKRRLAETRWPDEIPGSGWDYGANLGYLKGLIEYWRTGFDWRAQERLLNSFRQFKADLDGFGIHFIHVKGKGPRPFPLIISHGWPGSFFEIYKVIGPLSDPASHGGDPADAFDVVVPSLPGYGFSDRPTERGMNVARITSLFHRLMTDVLGYRRYAAQGGDWGSAITTRLGYAYPDSVVGIHLNLVTVVPGRVLRADQSEEVRAWVERRKVYTDEEYGYQGIQGTRPQTLAYGLNDSPVGLAAWIVEKFRRWSDCDGDVESVYTKDELLTNVMIYWVTGTINSSTRLYYEGRRNPVVVPPGERVKVPTGVAAFARDPSMPPRRLVEPVFNLQRWTALPSGGHFAALERPKELVEDVRAFFRPLRRGEARVGLQGPYPL